MKQILTLILVLILSLNLRAQENTNDIITRLKSNLEFLASDALRGREAGTEFEDVTVEFIISEFKKYGISKFKNDSSFLQKIPVITSRINNDSEVKIFDKDGHSTLLEIGNDWTTQPLVVNQNYMRQRVGIVFCGYGITASEYNYDDYEDVDVEGKIVLAFWGEPVSNDSNFFNGPAITKYYGPSMKEKVAREKGAIGLIFIPDAQLSQYWQYLKRLVMISNVTFRSDAGNYPDIIPTIVISPETGERILKNEESEMSTIQELMQKNEHQSFELSKSASIYVNTKIQDGEIENVIGYIEGSDPELKNEYIVAGAHYDHDGAWGDEVLNGADDNGSGTVAIMELMNQLKNAGLRRSVIGILFAGEEKGLLGSKYFADNFADKNKITASINIDMCGRENPDSLTSKGAPETSAELYELVQQVDAEMHDIVFYYEPGINSPLGTSDHASFASHGIPVVYFGDDMSVDLHLPSDDVDKINFTKIEKTVRVIKNLVKKIDSLDNVLLRNAK